MSAFPKARGGMRQYPHELSGGMRQRVMIAMATITGPDLLIADEPTTALDVTVQAQILEILRALKTDKKTAIALISHDMGVIAGIADRVQVMRHGEIVESGTVDDIFYAPKTRLYPHAAGRDAAADDDAGAAPPRRARRCWTVDDLKVTFPVKARACSRKTQTLRAVDGVSFTLRQGETLGVVGESGCGKSTLARAVLQLAAQRRRHGWCGWAAIWTRRRRATSARCARISRSSSRIRWPAWIRACRSAFPSPSRCKALEPRPVARRDRAQRVRAMMAACRPRSRLDQPLSA